MYSGITVNATSLVPVPSRTELLSAVRGIGASKHGCYFFKLFVLWKRKDEFIEVF